MIEQEVIREDIQREAKAAWEKSGGLGTLCMATGSGKSIVAINILKEMFLDRPDLKVLLVTPTIILHEINWKAEFEKFGALELYDKLERSCYVSLPKLNPTDYQLIVMDEVHHLSTLQDEEFAQGINLTRTKVLGLTATFPKHGDRKSRLDEICPVVYKYSIEEAAGSIVNDFAINVVWCKLDWITKNVKSGNKEKVFYTTEGDAYLYWTRRLEAEKSVGNQSGIKWMALTRKRLMDGFVSRLEYAKLVQKNCLGGFKSIIFAPSIEMAENMCENTIHSQTDRESLNAFINGTIDQISAVEMINEGITLGKVEAALIMKLGSTDKIFLQRVGRVCRNDMGKISQIYILVYKGTIEEKYLEESLSSIGESKVNYYEPNDLL